MELRNLNTFIVTAEKMNFSKAANHLGYTQAAVSIQIKQLEEELDTPLFDRIGRGIQLTEKGKEFLERAQHIVRYSDNSISLIKNRPSEKGIIKIGTSESILSGIMPNVIKEFHKQYPDVGIKLKTDIRDSLFTSLNHNEIDFAYNIDINLIDHKWTGSSIHEDKVYFVASPNHQLSQKDEVSIKDILKEDLAITESNVGYSYALFQQLAKNKLSTTPFLETGNTDFLKKMVIDNQAISYLPMYVVEDEIKNNKIRIIKLKEKDMEVTVYRQLYWHKNKYITKPMWDFMNIIESF